MFPRIRKVRLRRIAIKVLLDTSSYFITFAVAIFIYNRFRHGVYSIQVPPFLSLVWHGYIILILAIAASGGYANHKEFDRLSDLLATARGANRTIVTGIVLLFLIQVETSRILLILFFLLLPLVTVCMRILANALVEKVLRASYHDNTLIYGAGELGRSFWRIQKKGRSKLNVIGFIDDKPDPGTDSSLPLLGTFRDLSDLVSEYSVTRLVVAIPDLPRNRITELEYLAREMGIHIGFVPSQDLVNNPLKLRDFSGVTLAAYRSTENDRYGYNLEKRILDIFFSGILFLLSLPAWGVIWVLVKLDDGAALLFKQERVGLRGRHFQMYKFRSMHVAADKYAHCPTTATDPRVTRVGRWLRKTSLDELPQLLNVLRGDMSLVGPRPEMPFIVEQYNDFERQRLQVIPGITGLWQITEGRKAEITENLEYDLYYIENRCITLDLILLLLTGIFVLRGLTH